MFGSKTNFCIWIFIISQSILLFSCSKKEKNEVLWFDQPPRNQAIANKVNWYNNVIKRTYFANPDSSIKLSNEAALFFLKEKMPVKAFSAYIYMSEIALQRMGNEYKGMVYYMEAFRILKLYNGTDSLNPYFTIDIGNLLLRHNLTEQALINYKRALKLAEDQNALYVIAVAYNNIGLTFAAKKEFDSSRYFFHKALKIRKEISPVLCAHTEAYLCEIANKQEQDDSVVFYTNSVYKSLNEQSQTKENLSDLTDAGIKVTSYEVIAKTCRINSRYDCRRDNLTRSMINALTAIAAADTINRFDISSEMRLSVARLMLLGINPSIAIKREKNLIDSLSTFGIYTTQNLFTYWANNSIPKVVLKAIEKAHQAGSLPLEIEANRLLANLYLEKNEPKMAAFYFQKGLELSDSLVLFNTSEKGLSEQLMLANARIVEELESRKFHLAEKAKIIQNQNIFLFLLTIALLSLSLMAALLYSQKRRLYNTNMKLIGKTIALIQSGKKLFLIPETSENDKNRYPSHNPPGNSNNNPQKLIAQPEKLITRYEEKNEDEAILLGNSVSSTLFAGTKLTRFTASVDSNNSPNDKDTPIVSETQSDDTDYNNHYDALILLLESYMRETKSYLDKNITPDSLASSLKMDNSVILEIIRLKMGCSFEDYIDEWRIREACQLLSLEKQNKEPISHLYLKTGFKSSTAFHEAFLKFTGVSPEFFQKNIS